MARIEGSPLGRFGTAEAMASTMSHTAENMYMPEATVQVSGRI